MFRSEFNFISFFNFLSKQNFLEDAFQIKIKNSPSVASLRLLKYMFMRLEQLRESSVDLKTIENCFKQHLSFYKVITKTFLS